jgi:hypothetical protein
MRVMDSTQLGRAGELALILYGLVTAEGRLELFSPVADDDHVDLVAGLRGGLPALAIQVKTSDGLDKDGLVEARASYIPGQVRDDPAFLYAVVLLKSVEIKALWVVPSPDFNRLVYRTATAGKEVLEFRGSPDKVDAFAAFRIEPSRVGPALVSRIEALPGTAPEWLRALMLPRLKLS